MEQVEEQSTSTCRICLGHLDFLRNIYDPNFKHLLDLLYRLLGYQVHIDGGLFNICPSCEGKLVWVGEFKDHCEKSLEQFKFVDCKKELIDIEDIDNDVHEHLSESSASDSDAPLRSLKRRKIILKRACKSVKKAKVDNVSAENDRKSKRDKIKQFPNDEVLQAIDENTTLTSDVKYRTCIHCNYVAMVPRSLTYHMQSTHENVFENWCNYCNIQTDELKNHRNVANCSEIQCKFCERVFSSRNMLDPHLQTHCYEIFNPDLGLSNINENKLSEAKNSNKDDNHHIYVENKFSNSSEEDSDYIPQLDSDSDYVKSQKTSSPRGRPKKLQKVLRTTNPKKRVVQSELKKITSLDDNPDIHKPNASKQFPEEEVLQAITESTRYFTDIKNRTCIHCKWEAGTAKILSVHMKRKHIKSVQNWCYHCNEQTKNLELHKDTTNCDEHQCQFCKKIFLKAFRLTTHLRTHSHKAFTELYKDADDDVRRLKQFPASEVSQAISEYESYMTELKNRKCILCDFVAPISTTLRLHMTMKHEQAFEKWCKHCNLQTDDLQKHMDETKCQEQLCRFCNKIFGNIKYFVQHLRTHCKTELNHKQYPNESSILRDDTKLKPRRQFAPNEVLQAISECTSYITDIKFRRCNLCDFEGPKTKALTLHMRFGHKDTFETWCSRCNIQTDNLPGHKKAAKCLEERCKLCNKIFPSVKRLTRHLKSHCRRIFKRPGDDLDFEWEDHQIQMQLDETNSNSDSMDTSNITISKNISTTEHTPKTNGENNDETKHEEVSEASEADISPQESEDDDDKDDANNHRKKKRGRLGPLKQFSKDVVYKAIMDCMKCFFTNRSCIVCGYLTLNSKCLGTHMASHKEIKDKWCSLCNALVGDVSKHWETHKSDFLKCIFCARASESTECLKDHLRRHCRAFTFDPKQKWFVCKVCPNSFPEEKQLNEHECKGYDPKKVNGAALCTICNKRVHNLRVHMKQKHSPDSHKKGKEKGEALKKKLCPICGKTFMISYLQAHMYSHTGEMPYKCSYCGKGFPLMSILRSHVKRHTGEKPFVCHICGKGFVTGSEHRSHTQIHEGGPVTCTVCKKEFSRPGVLKLHMRRHTGENPFSCLHCGISYHRKSLLLNHMRTHSDERPYKCSFCEKDFRDARTLQQHENIHKGIKPYTCSMCSFSCTQSHALTSHMKQHPEDAPQADRPYKCLYCYRTFSTNAMLMSHTNHNHRESNVT